MFLFIIDQCTLYSFWRKHFLFQVPFFLCLLFIYISFVYGSSVVGGFRIIVGLLAVIPGVGSSPVKFVFSFQNQICFKPNHIVSRMTDDVPARPGPARTSTIFAAVCFPSPSHPLQANSKSPLLRTERGQTAAAAAASSAPVHALTLT